MTLLTSNLDINIRSEEKKEYLLVVSKSKLSITEHLLAHAKSMYNEISKHGATKILVDGTKITFPQSLFAFSDLVKFYINTLPTDLKSRKIAVVIKDADKKIVAYWETVCANKGFGFRAFITFKEAGNWLNKGKMPVRFA